MSSSQVLTQLMINYLNRDLPITWDYQGFLTVKLTELEITIQWQKGEVVNLWHPVTGFFELESLKELEAALAERMDESLACGILPRASRTR